ncbi:sigma 54-interacting transcriptional regulator [Alicyclobacillus cycloheptanicus]|uniref:PAS domain S-box-containing protein n=1 Tax=Alicyclobacillus cycloheptanicus TaxID=1457 RepID=A0ABT9XFS0_9BACL|nr:sigma 54-interacting transcriptional regulator [Alicyclobacillus cycloheptanicus]MDQ0189032.1 PAS domain S-box-containing protein [Alicyclobacillus cycloheptanicus]WDM00170.1 sigma 54-interacting transcriptional regulator [Alicyclobacillus cycloheptanicus]
MWNEREGQIHAFYESLLDAMPEAVTVVDRSGTVLSWNRAAERLYEIPREDIVGQPIAQFFQRASLMLLQVMDSGLPVYGVYHQPRPDKHVYINTVPVTDDSGELIGAISIEQDITDVVRLNEERFHQQDMGGNEQWQPILDTSNRDLKEALTFLEQLEAADPSAAVLLIGESGVGKSILARFIHAKSRSGPFVSIDCRALTEGLLDVELFGQDAHYFAHASTQKVGKLELAAEGTVFLRHIDKMAVPTQAKLAQALQEGGITKSDGEFTPLRCRIIASIDTAPVENAASMSEDHRDAPSPVPLTPELLYMFHPMTLPPLRERREDIAGICRFYLRQASNRLGKPLPTLRPEVTAALAAYTWPGNLTEVQRTMERLVITGGEAPLDFSDIPPAMRPMTVKDVTDAAMSLGSLAEEFERERIQHAMAQTGGNKAKAARLLGISRGALYYKLRRYGMSE